MIVFSHYFGSYLFNKNIITAEQLKEILALQNTVHVKIGVLAVNYGYMDTDQVKEVLELQKNKDNKFGEIAVELGYLTEKQVQSLLQIQQEGLLQLSHAIVESKILTLAQFEKMLARFKEDCQLTDRELEILKQGDINEIVRALIDFNTPSLNEILYKYTVLMVKNIIRLLDEKPYIKKEKLPTKYIAECLVFQEIKGKYRIFTGIAGSKDVFIRLASNYAHERLTDLDELAKDAIAEFFNVNNGVFLVNLSKQNIELNMNPQQFHERKNIKRSGTYIIPIYLKEGEIRLIISPKNFLSFFF